MASRNRLRDNPVNTRPKEINRDGFHFKIWARYFPTEGVEYHVELISVPRHAEFEIEVYCVLKGGAGDALKLNRSTKASIRIDGSTVRFDGIPPLGKNSGFAVCGVEQISLIREIDVHCEGFRKLS